MLIRRAFLFLSLVAASPTHDQPQIQTITITAAPSIPSATPEFVSTDKFTSAILNSTNFFRTAYNATSVVYNATLARFATDYLNGNKNCEFRHSGGPYGENIALGCSDARSCVEAWGNERAIYDFGDPGFDHDTGHFTQLVWKNTTDVGCGRRLCGGRGWYLVCEYFPRGNVDGQFGEEVQGAVSAGEKSAGMGLRNLALLWIVAICFAL